MRRQSDDEIIDTITALAGGHARREHPGAGRARAQGPLPRPLRADREAGLLARARRRRDARDHRRGCSSTATRSTTWRWSSTVVVVKDGIRTRVARGGRDRARHGRRHAHRGRLGRRQERDRRLGAGRRDRRPPVLAPPHRAPEDGVSYDDPSRPTRSASTAPTARARRMFNGLGVRQARSTPTWSCRTAAKVAGDDGALAPVGPPQVTSGSWSQIRAVAARSTASTWTRRSRTYSARAAAR